jgi:Ca2+-binding RTX toxin-like protein
VHCLVGTAYADHLTGSPGPDRLAVCETWSPRVERRRNTVRAGAGDDEVVGCEGPDDLVLGDGDDTGTGGGGADTVHGGAGSDDLLGLGGADHLDGGPGRDDGCRTAVRGRVRGTAADVTVSVERLTPCP